MTPKITVKEPENPRPGALPKIEDSIIAEYTKWVKEHTPTKVREWVRDVLESQKKRVLLQYLGFSDRWDGWEFDHCNGRRSALDTKIKDVIEDEAEKVLTKALKNGVTLTSAQVKTVQREYVEQLLWRCKESARNQAQRDADTLITTILDTDADYHTREEVLEAIARIGK